MSERANDKDIFGFRRLFPVYRQSPLFYWRNMCPPPRQTRQACARSSNLLERRRRLMRKSPLPPPRHPASLLDKLSFFFFFVAGEEETHTHTQQKKKSNGSKLFCVPPAAALPSSFSPSEHFYVTRARHVLDRILDRGLCYIDGGNARIYPIIIVSRRLRAESTAAPVRSIPSTSRRYSMNA